jgi:hypothetical protein
MVIPGCENLARGTRAAITLMTKHLTRRTARPAERRDVTLYDLAQGA